MHVVRRVWRESQDLAYHRGLHGGGGLHDGDEGMKACHPYAGAMQTFTQRLNMNAIVQTTARISWGLKGVCVGNQR